MWTEGKDFPWPDSSDAAIPDMFIASARMQDAHRTAPQRDGGDRNQKMHVSS